MTHHADGHAHRMTRHADAFLHCRNNPLRGNDGLNRLRRMSMRMPRRQWPADIFSSSKCFSLLKNNFQRWQRYSIRVATWLQRPPCLDELHEGGKSLCNRPAGGACPKGTPSANSIPSGALQEADYPSKFRLPIQAGWTADGRFRMPRNESRRPDPAGAMVSRPRNRIIIILD